MGKEAPSTGSRRDLPHPEETAPWWSLGTFHWATGLHIDGWTRHRAVQRAIKDLEKRGGAAGAAADAVPLSEQDVWRLPTNEEARNCSARFIVEWEKELAEHSGGHGGQGRVPAGLERLAAMELDLNSTIVGVSDSNIPHATVEMKGTAAADDKSGPEFGSDAKNRPSLMRAVWRTYRKKFFVAAVLRLTADACGIASPLVLRQLIGFLSQSSAAYSAGQPLPESWRGYVMAFGLGAILVLQSFCMNWTWLHSQRIGFEIKTSLMSYTYTKLLKLSSGSRLKHTGGTVVNLVSTDATRIDRAIPELHTLYSGPISISVGIILLILNLGWPAIVGAIVLIFIMVPVTGFVMKKAGELRAAGSKWTDLRSKFTNEAVSGIRVIKFLGYTKPITATIMDDMRAPEMDKVRQILFYRVYVGLVSMAGPIIASIVMFLCYSAAGGEFTPAIILSSIAMLEIIRWPLLLLPMALSWAVDAWVSLGRFQELFEAEEVQERGHSTDGDGQPGLVTVSDNTVFQWDSVPPQETLDDAVKDQKSSSKNFVWRTLDRTFRRRGKPGAGETAGQTGGNSDTKDALAKALEAVPETDDRAPSPGEEALKPEATKFTLSLPAVTFSPGSLTLIVGPVGAGKSTLLAGLIGDVKLLSGNVALRGSIAYAAQSPWIQSASIRGNVLFGAPFNAERYAEVLRVCSLERDLATFPDGDFTVVGEKGLSLSGGQKARLALARAIYQDASVYVLDDILSALDSHTGAFVFEQCIRGYLKSKTVIMATHALHILSAADQIICLKRGAVVEMGSYRDLVGFQGSTDGGAGYLARMVKEYGLIADSDSVLDTTGSEGSETGTAQVDAPVVSVDEGKDAKAKYGEDPGTARALFADEERYSGAVTLSVWLKYFKAMGGAGIVLGIVLSLCLMQISRILTDWWIATVWSRGTFGLSLGGYQGIYVAIGMAQVLLVLTNGLLVATGGARSAKKLHDDALLRVFGAPVAFFDRTPVGRILNRFSKDVESLDTFVPDTLRFFIRMVGQCISTIIFIIVVTPIFAAPLVPLAALYLMISTFYRATARDVKRMEAISRSPLYALYSETLAGLATIRAFQKTVVFQHIAEDRLDSNNVYWFAMMYTVRWLSLRLEVISSILVLLSATFAVLASQTSATAPGLLGLAVTNAMQISFVLNYVVELGSEIETQMIAAERLLSYAEELPQEAPAITDVRPPPEWPSAGAVDFQDLEMRYAPDLPLVLKGVSFVVQPGERVGIVGRTGAGKSSITNALFRLVEPCGGKITIDGIDHTKIGLDDVRTRLSIITQDSVLFSGTLRFNLDPFKLYSDQEIMDVLEHAGNIKELVLSHPDGLLLPISENGESLSNGQRQLVSLARVMLRRSRIVVLDEATASADADTDSAIQRTLREDERFRGTSILTIAHRLLTIIDYDKIVVLSHGEILEFGSPAELVSKPDGSFRALVDQTGPEQAPILIEMAQKAAERKAATRKTD
ncbi:P-loop containing nucleoside triphosphate hydrolase protein [Hyaloraphidium curvatum]|nr:P-loop containing nucleoside triphosphate hydrolase protein [Hyaloraphidium curvatum]